ncbi:acetoin utilization protein AcuC [Nocardia sp. NBC_01377]|uniref:acetoin utilization protein AcuC n=1 Tax=Nocardia sp. NBC_01377 TaxID=2903595 RepID=UPI003245969D
MATTPRDEHETPLRAAPTPRPETSGRGKVVWTDRFLEYAWTPQHPMKPARLKFTMALAESLGLLEGIERLSPEPAGVSDLLRVHTAEYVEAVRHAVQPPGQPQAPPFGLGSADNPVFPQMHAAASVIVGGTLAAAREIAEGRTRRAISIGGGMHHAMPNSAAGFCVYNDAAVSISWLLDHGFDRVAYLDVDVHHGDGVQRAFYSDPRVLTVSIHQHPATLWPNTGWPEETGMGAAEGTAINLAVLPGTRDAQWLRGFHAVVPGALEAFRPQIVVSQCGVDTHREDPLADLELTVDGQRAAFLAMRELADRHAEGRWLAVGGGGYGLYRVVPRAWTHLLAAALDRDIAPETPVPQEWIEMIRAEAPMLEPPRTMGDGGDISYRRWDGPGGTGETGDAHYDRAQRAVDTAVLATRRASFGLLGLDPEDPRD